MRVATWNIWWKFGPWEARQGPIADELAQLDADVVCLQEVWAEGDTDQAVVLAEHVGHHMARSTDSDGQPHRFGNAVISRWPVLESFTKALPGFDGDPSHRSALFCRIEVPEAAHPWWVVTTHLEWRYAASRLRQTQLQSIVDEAALLRSVDGDTIVIIAGDFNSVADSDEIRRLTGLSEPYDPSLVFTDAWSAVSDEPGHTWTRDNPHSANAQWPRRRLDGVFVGWPRPKPTGNPLRAGLFGTEARNVDGGASTSVVPSDHYGVVVQLDRRTLADLEATS